MVSLSVKGLLPQVLPLSCMLLLACTGRQKNDKTPETTETNPPNVGAIDALRLAQDLLTFDSCQALGDHLKRIAVLNLEAEKAWQIKSLDGQGRMMAPTVGAPEAMEDETASSAGGASKSTSAPSSHTTTNNQVDGVEEADFIKNTGTHIFQLAGNKLHIVQSWPANEMKVLATLGFIGNPYRLLLDKDTTLIVLANKVEAEASKERVYDATTSYYHAGLTEVYIVDIKDKSAPRIKQTYEVPGYVSEARRVGTSLRLLSSEYFAMRPQNFEWLDYEEVLDAKVSRQAKLAKIERLFARNRAIIDELGLDFWLRGDMLSRLAGQKRNVDEELCRSVHAVNTSTTPGLTKVTTINIADETISDTILTSSVDHLYMSADHLYLITPYSLWQPQTVREDLSYVHKFDIKDPSKANYRGSGQVPGMPLNQFSMDEYENDLRIATTIYERDTSAGAWSWRSSNSYSKIFVLREQGEGLSVIGTSGKMGETEQIYSVRYHGAWGYVVTFRQVDPLYTVDLSDPTNPQIVGELKVPGFSSYIHLLDDKHLLTVGRDATPTGQVLATKISVFDVSDKKQPKETASYSLKNEGWASSEAEWEHKAFTFYRERSLLAIPQASYAVNAGGYQYSSKLYLFKVGASEVTEQGSLELEKAQSASDMARWCWYNQSEIRRSIFADDVVYAIGNHGIKSALSSNPKAVLGQVSFELEEQCQWRK